MKFKIGDKVKVAEHNDNEGYESFKDKILVITNSCNKGFGYDSSMSPQGLYCFETLEGEEINCSLYDYELEEI